jgi:ribosomal protein S18 acetylase RimI-like enzyme
MEYLTIDKHDEEYIQQVAYLHDMALSHRSFITSFGQGFLSQLYKGILAHHLGFIILALAQNRVCGFAIGCIDSTKLLRLIIKNIFSFAKYIIPQVIRHPSMLKKTIESALYSSKEDIPIKPELLVIIVDDKYRSQGIGTTLINKLNHEFQTRAIKEYKVTVHEVMDRANHFYVKNGLELAKQFRFYGIPWNIYVKSLVEGKIVK